MATTEHVAIAGRSRNLALVLAGFGQAKRGIAYRSAAAISATLPEAITGRRISYVASDSYLFPLSVRDNLILWTQASDRCAMPCRTIAIAAKRQLAVLRPQRSGNPPLDPAADWVDYEAAGAADAQDLLRKLLDVIADRRVSERRRLSIRPARHHRSCRAQGSGG